MYILTTYTTDDSDLDLVPVVVLASATSVGDLVQRMSDEIMDDCACSGSARATLIGDDADIVTLDFSSDAAVRATREMLGAVIGVADGKYSTVDVNLGKYRNVYTINSI